MRKSVFWTKEWPVGDSRDRENVGFGDTYS
jgi:hypothetical protein